MGRMPITSLEAVDLLRFADQISDRLAAAQTALEKKRGHDREKAWLADAAKVLNDARSPGAGLVDRARALPELADLRQEFAGSLQGVWVDGLEKLLAGITFHVSSRSPVIESLFPHQKLATLRRAPRDVATKFQRDFEKRAKSSYVARMLGGEDFAFALPVLEQLRSAWADYEACFSGEGLPADEAAPLRESLHQAGERVEGAVRQAKLLAEAALVPFEGLFEEVGLGQKLRKRTGRVAGALNAQPEPTADELAAEEAQAAAEAMEQAAAADAVAQADAAADVVAEAGRSAPVEAAPETARAQGEVAPPKAPRKRKAKSTEAAATPPEGADVQS